MDIKLILFIIAGLIYLFAGRKKKQAPPTPTRRFDSKEEYENEPTASKPMTFEDLLREIEGSKKPAPIPQRPAYETPKPSLKPTIYDQVVAHRKKPLEDTQYDYRKHDRIYEVYEEAKKAAFVKPSLEETMKVQDTVVRFNQFKPYETDHKRKFRQDLLIELKQPQSFKKAFIMSEILQRKF